MNIVESLRGRPPVPVTRGSTVCRTHVDADADDDGDWILLFVEGLTRGHSRVVPPTTPCQPQAGSLRRSPWSISQISHGKATEKLTLRTIS